MPALKINNNLLFKDDRPSSCFDDGCKYVCNGSIISNKGDFSFDIVTNGYSEFHYEYMDEVEILKVFGGDHVISIKFKTVANNGWKDVDADFYVEWENVKEVKIDNWFIGESYWVDEINNNHYYNYNYKDHPKIYFESIDPSKDVKLIIYDSFYHEVDSVNISNESIVEITKDINNFLFFDIINN